MSPEEKIDPLSPYRGIRPLREGSVFSKYRVKKKTPKKRETSEEEMAPEEKKESQHRVDIEA